jgi:hypothetical protein
MSEEPVKLQRMPVSTNCSDCGCKLPFGVYAWWIVDQEQAICIEDGVKRGWSDKARARTLVKILEEKQDLKALHEEIKVATEHLSLVKKEIDLFTLGKNDEVLEQKNLALIELVNDYIRHGANENEKKALGDMLNEIEENKKLQHEIREQVQSRWFILSQVKKRKPIPKIES